MMFRGIIKKTGKEWLVRVPELDLLTQASSKKACYRMILDAIETLLHPRKVDLEIVHKVNNQFRISGKDTPSLLGLLLQRQRQKQGLTLRQAAANLGSMSPNAFARYEKGRVSPNLETLSRLLKAINPKNEIVLTWEDASF